MPGIELKWPNKDRILYRVPQRGESGRPQYYGDPDCPEWPDKRPLRRLSVHGEPDADPNRLILGDNLVALQALVDQGMAGKFKCICIDPPYNTGSAFAHYDDFYENTIWLGMMKDHLSMLKELLKEDGGTIWIIIDNAQSHYLKVICDGIFGRQNFKADIAWQKRTSPDARLDIGDAHDNILVYSKDSTQCKLNKLELDEAQKSQYKNPDNDIRGAWVSTDFTGMTGHATPSQFYTITTPSGIQYPPPEGRCWALAESTFLRLADEGRVWFGKNNDSRPRLKRYLSEHTGITSWTWWTNSEAGHNQEAKKESIDLFGKDDAFGTPKPERLIRRILQLSTNEGDWVLDSFAGSGTTAAVAYQMNRKFVTIEIGEHARTHCLPRLEKVRMGAEPYKFAAHGGFVFEEVGPPVIVKDDDFGIERIHPDYVNGEYQKAVCLLAGFTHRKDDALFHGRAGEQGARFCHVADRGTIVTADYLAPLAEAISRRADGGEAATCVVYAARVQRGLELAEGVELVRIPEGFKKGRQER